MLLAPRGWSRPETVSNRISLLLLGYAALSTACGSENAGAASANAGGAAGAPDAPAGGSAGSSGSSGSGNGATAAGHAGSAGAAGGGGSAAGGQPAVPTWPSGPIRPTRFRIPDPSAKVPPCAIGGEGIISKSEVLLGQSHLTPVGWPFQTISADRPLTIAVAATGTGAAPVMVATALIDGKEQSTCLEGPATLPAGDADLTRSTYRGSFPAAWVKPGLRVRVSIGDDEQELELTVAPPSWLTLYVVDAQLFGDGTNEPTSDAQWRELLARLPVSYLDVGQSPFGVWRPQHLLIEARDDGHAPDGSDASHPAIVVDDNPHCSAADKSAKTCTPHSGFGTMSAVLGALDGFREANGLQSSSTWYADLAKGLGGGLAGGQRGTGDDTGLIMNHELGHAWGFPHWAADDLEYPYEGVQRDRGGFGDRWGFDQTTGLPLSPLCKNLERQSPMQRADTCVPEGSWFDVYSDYEAARLLRMTLGAAEPVSGDVPYAGGIEAGATRRFTLPKESGRELLAWNAAGPGFQLEHYDEAAQSFEPLASSEWNRVEAAEVPVVMFSGVVLLGEGAFFEAPISYVGNVLGKLDPADAADYAKLYAVRSSELYWAHDLCFRFTLADGTVLHRLYGSEAELRQDGDYARFAFNLPRELGDAVKKLELVQRPLGQYDESSRLDASDSSASYFDGSKVLGTWSR